MGAARDVTNLPKPLEVDSDVDSDAQCSVCGQTRQWHVENETIHSFVSTNARDRGLRRSDKEPQSGQETEGVSSAPDGSEHHVAGRAAGGDLVLRLTLVRLGIIKEADLTETEALVRDAMNAGQMIVVRPTQDHDETRSVETFDLGRAGSDG